jgi:DNA-binding NarL/FixJ family response regulator
MDDFVNPVELRLGSHKSPVLVIIERHILMRTCILNILKRELPRFEIVEMSTTSGLDRVSGRDVRLIVLDIGDKPIIDPAIEDDLAVLKESFPDTPVALLSNRDDEATTAAAIRRGVRGFIPTSLPVDVAIAGLRLVLAGSVYRPLTIDIRLNQTPSLYTPPACIEDSSGQPGANEVNGAHTDVTQKLMIDLTPREMHVLAALQLGLPNKLIAARLNLSENTVKMHIQHIMRKSSATNRTEAVLRWSRLLSERNGGERL